MIDNGNNCPWKFKCTVLLTSLCKLGSVKFYFNRSHLLHPSPRTCAHSSNAVGGMANICRRQSALVSLSFSQGSSFIWNFVFTDFNLYLIC